MTMEREGRRALSDGVTERATSSAGRISKDPDVRRTEIMTAALQLFTTQGYEGTSISAITDAVGVAKGLFYHYFASKADLLNQITRWQSDEFLATLPRHAAEMEGEPLDKMRQVMGRIVQWKFEDIRPLTLAYLKMMYRDENTVLRVKLTKEYVFRLVPLFGEIIAEAVDAGVADAKDPELSAQLVFGTWVGGADMIAELMIALPGHPELVDPLLERVRAWENAVERILGIQEGALELYDYEYVRTALERIAVMETGENDLSKGDV